MGLSTKIGVRCLLSLIIYIILFYIAINMRVSQEVLVLLLYLCQVFMEKTEELDRITISLTFFVFMIIVKKTVG